MSIIARLGVWLGLNSTEFVKGLDDATKKTKEFEKNQLKQLKNAEKATADMMAMAGRAAAGFAAVAYGVGQAFKYADDISDTAAALDLTVESLIALKGALQASGNSADNVAQLFSKLAAAQENAQTGNEGLRDSFAKLGISGKDVDNLNLEDLFKRVATELSKVEDTTKRTAIAQELLGKAAKGTDWKGFVDQYKSFADPSLARAVSENAKSWDNIEKAMKNIGLLIQSLVQPFAIVLNHAFDLMNVFDHIKAGGSVESDLGAAMGMGTSEEGSPSIMGGYGAPPKKEGAIAKAPVAGGYKQQSKEQEALSQRLRSEIVKANAEYQKRLDILKDTLKFDELDLIQNSKRMKMSSDDFELSQSRYETLKKLAKLSGEQDREQAAANAEYEAQSGKEKNKKLLDEKLKNINEYYRVAREGEEKNGELAIQKLQEQIDLRNKYINEDLVNQTQKESKAIEMRRDAAIDLLDLDSRAYKMRQNDYDLAKLRITAAQELADIEEKYAEKRKEIQTEFERTGKSQRDIELRDLKIKSLEEVQNAEIMALTQIDKKRQDNLLADIERQQSWAAGWNEAFKNYTEASEKASSQGAAAFQMVASQMEGAIKNFVETGKFAFKDLVGSIIKDLLYMQMKAQATSIFNMISGSIMNMFPAGNGSMEAFGAMQYPGKASGGAINSPTIVGENGAELFIPSTPGTIIPNGSWQQMAANSGSSGFTNNGTYIANMSAIDTQSATQFLAKNKSTIWAAYQSANRSVPISR